MTWSKIFDLKKKVFACETVAFIKKYAIAAYFLNPPLTNYNSY